MRPSQRGSSRAFPNAHPSPHWISAQPTWEGGPVALRNLNRHCKLSPPSALRPVAKPHFRFGLNRVAPSSPCQIGHVRPDVAGAVLLYMCALSISDFALHPSQRTGGRFTALRCQSGSPLLSPRHTLRSMALPNLAFGAASPVQPTPNPIYKSRFDLACVVIREISRRRTARQM